MFVNTLRFWVFIFYFLVLNSWVLSVLCNFSNETEFLFLSISLDLSNKTHSMTVDSFSQVNQTGEALKETMAQISNNWSEIAFVMSSFPSHFIWSQTYAHTFNAETLPYVIYTCSLPIYIYIKENAIRQILANMFGKAEWESLPFIVRPLREGLIYHFSTGLKQRLSYRTGRCDRYTLILVSVYQVWVRGMLLTKWRNILLMPLALSTGRPGNSVDSNLVWRCACVRD